MEKVKLPYGIVKAIEKIRAANDDPRTLFNYPSIASHAQKNLDYKTINTYINSGEEHFKKYFQAISFGYEIEKTPELELKERYEYYLKSGKKVSANAILETLEVLGLKINGIR